MKFTVFIAIAATAFISVAGQAGARNSFTKDEASYQQSRLRMESKTRPPIGHVRFCESHPSDCLDLITGELKVRLTGGRLEQLKFINTLINEQIEPVSDQDQYGQIEHWTYPESGRGDCEDYVLLKKRELIRLGWSPRALLITVVRDEYDEGHAVLTVRTDRGDLILDNKVSEIRSPRKSGYFYIKRQSAHDPRSWVSLIPNRSTPTVSASGLERQF